jgi:protein-tyrosine phosphatase
MTPKSSIFKILVVCTGNICRSPLAERLLHRGFESIAPAAFQVQSAGVNSLIGAPIDRRAAELIRQHGGDTDRFAARPLSLNLIEGQDLVLAMDRGHRRAIVELSPMSISKTFTIREFARILASIEPEMSKNPPPTREDLVAACSRSRFPITDMTQDDVVDPYRRDADTYKLMLNQALPSIQSILNAPW